MALQGLFVRALASLAHHVFSFILLVVCLILGFLLLYMIYSPLKSAKEIRRI